MSEPVSIQEALAAYFAARGWVLPEPRPGAEYPAPGRGVPCP